MDMVLRLMRDCRHAVRAVVLLSSYACGSSDPSLGDIRPFVGSFAFEEGFVLATCDGSIAAHDLTGTEIDIVERGTSDVEFIAGATCRFGLSVRDRSASNQSDSGCKLSVRSVALDATFRRFRVEQLNGDKLGVFGAGVADAVIAEQRLRCDPFELNGTLTPVGEQ